MTFYKDVTKSPLAKWLIDAGLEHIDPTFVEFFDSSWQDCDDGRSTGGYTILFQGGLISFNSFVPQPIAMSTAEAEINAGATATAQVMHVRQAIMELLYGNPDIPFTVPVLTDSTAADAITSNERDTSRTRHIERRYLKIRHLRRSGHISVHHVPAPYNLADVPTKVMTHAESHPRCQVLEPVPAQSASQSQRGVTAGQTTTGSPSPAPDPDAKSLAPRTPRPSSGLQVNTYDRSDHLAPLDPHDPWDGRLLPCTDSTRSSS